MVVTLGAMARHRKRPPAWLLGLVLAVIVLVLVLVLFNVLGYGDDPVVEGVGRAGLVVP